MQSQKATAAQQTNPVQQSPANAALPAVPAAPIANAAPQLTPQQLALFTALFGGGSNPIDPRVAFGGHQQTGPPLQVKNTQPGANPFVIEAKGAVKVSEIKGPNGQTQVIIDASGNHPPPRRVTLKPGEDPPEIEGPKLAGLLGALI